MNELQSQGDWSPYIALFVAGGFPWITQIKDLDIHFTYNGQSFREIFNAFASLFAFSIFFFMKTEVTDRFAYYFGLWPWFIVLAFFFVTAYLLLVLKSKTPTMGGMVIRFVSYVLIFCTLVAGFGLLYFEKDYYMISGQIGGVDKTKARIEIYDRNGAGDNELRKVVYSDEAGEFYLTLKKDLAYESVVIYHSNIKTDGNSRSFTIYDPIFTTFENLDVGE